MLKFVVNKACPIICKMAICSEFGKKSKGIFLFSLQFGSLVYSSEYKGFLAAGKYEEDDVLRSSPPDTANR